MLSGGEVRSGRSLALNKPLVEFFWAVYCAGRFHFLPFKDKVQVLRRSDVWTGTSSCLAFISRLLRGDGTGKAPGGCYKVALLV